MKTEQYYREGDYYINRQTGIQVYAGSKKAADPRERRLMELINGAKPLNKEEKKMVKDIQKIKDAGQIVDIPFM